ncbi:MAG: hypothetical protein A2Z35_05830 [Actinobacteria bacterium RBG_19FT_COMBO_36_27]|nr:MAG: hypothetical protein A2Z35_05830 [Actinobacteria bacterium RBG_19FT_COMBO_36_27]
MNLLVISNQSEAIELMKRYKGNYTFISKRKLTKEQLPAGYKIGANVRTYAHTRMKKGLYYTKINWNNIPPLDSQTIEALSYCEAETLKMFERIGKVNAQLYSSRKQHYMNHLRYWNYILDVNKIDVFYRCAPPHEGYDNVIYHLCLYKKIPIYMFYQLHPKLAYFARNVREPLPNITDIYKKMLDDYKDNNNKEEILRKGLRTLMDEHWNKKIPSVSPTIIPDKKKGTQKNLLKLHKGLLKFYASQCVKPNYNKPYIYFPLHYQYEATTCPMGGIYSDQLLAIELLSRAGIQVYVKEHPRMSKNRSLAYYKKLLSMPNVSLVSIKADNYALIDNSFCVSTITGTAGWQAILRGKTCLMFGFNFYQYAPGCFQIKTLEDLKPAIDGIKSYVPNRAHIEIFLKSMEEFLFDHNTISNMTAFSNELKKLEKERLMNDEESKRHI